ncbi:MAG: aldolase [Deltaproteobacteria bacterium]|nr:MAG: aldolase [Deltaproteobacteria bacterium]
MTHDEKRNILHTAGLNLVKAGLVARTWGNISIRLDDDWFLITPSGRTYETLTPGEMVVVNRVDLSHEGTITPSSEKGMHADIYTRRPEITAVIHTHQLQASTVAAARKTVTGLSADHAAVLGESVLCADYALPGTRKLVLAAAKALVHGRNAALLANHGAVCIGETMEAAFTVAVILEAACEDFIKRSFEKKYGACGLTVSGMHEHYLTQMSA